MPSILIASAHELSTQLREMTAVFIWSRERGLLGATNGLEVSRLALRRHWNRAEALSLSLSSAGQHVAQMVMSAANRRHTANRRFLAPALEARLR